MDWSQNAVPLKSNGSDEMDDTTAEELQAILTGSGLSFCLSSLVEAFTMIIETGAATPRHIPVNIIIPNAPSPSQPTFDDLNSMDTASSPIHRPKLIMRSPEKPPLSGMLEITVAYDEQRPRGVRVELNRTEMDGGRLDVLEEVVRRGGVLGLVGRVFASSK